MFGKSTYTDYTINTVLICVQCRRTQVITGEGSWFDVGEPYTGVNHVTSPFFTSCWRCGKEYAFPDMEMERATAEYRQELSRIEPYVGTPVTFPVVVSGGNGANPRTIEACHLGRERKPCAITTNIDMVLNRVYCKASICSLDSNGFGKPHTDFFDKGGCAETLEFSFALPFILHSVLFCPNCTRNVVLCSPASAHPLEKNILESMIDAEYNEMSEIVVVNCRQCKDTLGISEFETCMKVAELMLRNDRSLSKIRDYFPGNTEFAKINNRSGEDIQVLLRENVVSSLKHHSELYSLSTTETDVRKVHIVENFI